MRDSGRNRHARASLLGAAAAIVLTMTAFPVEARDYYVHARAGGDAKPGTMGEPWQTLGKVNATSFSPGDRILFARGERWKGMLVVSSAGSPGAPITYGAYGTGPKPLLDGLTDVTAAPYSWKAAASLSTATKKVWYLANGPSGFSSKLMVWSEGGVSRRLRQRWTAVDALLDKEWGLKGSTPDYGSWTFYVRSDAGPPGVNGSKAYMGKDFSVLVDTNGKSHLVIEGLAVRGAITKHGMAAVQLNDSDYVTISGCEIYYNTVGLGSLGAPAKDANHCIIKDNDVHDNTENGIYLSGRPAGNASYNLISGNDVHHNWNLGETVGDRCAIAISGDDAATNRTGNVIEGNAVHHNGTFGISPDAAVALYQVDETIVRYNDVHDNDQPAFYFAFRTTDSSLYYNLFWNNRTDGDLIRLQGTDNLSAYNNLIADNRIEQSELAPNYNHHAIFRIDGPAKLWNVKNNIFVSNRTTSTVDFPALISFSASTNGTMDNNLYFDNLALDKSGVPAAQWKNGASPARATFAAWQGLDKRDVKGVAADPRFVAAEAHDYHLRSGSPAIDKGASVPVDARDYEGTPLPQGIAPDIGIDERRIWRRRYLYGVGAIADIGPKPPPFSDMGAPEEDGVPAYGDSEPEAGAGDGPAVDGRHGGVEGTPDDDAGDDAANDGSGCAYAYSPAPDRALACLGAWLFLWLVAAGHRPRPTGLEVVQGELAR